mmetsp:Transcript_9057/g.13944  ORF Transcript_9057/g.13944 Transcript_9057/m.13944 type:complete len:886 (+) Transcript_9057:22-2679(+)
MSAFEEWCEEKVVVREVSLKRKEVVRSLTIGLFDFYKRVGKKSCDESLLEKKVVLVDENTRLSIIEGDYVASVEKISRCWRPRRCLTSPEEKVEGNDNDQGELVVSCGDVIKAREMKFEVIDKLGKGSFGQVFRCRSLKSGRLCAIKIVKNRKSYVAQAQLEAGLARALTVRIASANIVKYFCDFSFENHVCLVFEALSMNMYELLKNNQFRGLPLNSVRHLSQQIIAALCALDDARIIHSDLKPENILLVQSEYETDDGAEYLVPEIQKFATRIKLIDLGSAAVEGRATQTYVQSRFYRAPEILIGAPYDCAIDAWSCACVSAELMLGLPIFPGTSTYNQIARIVEMLGLIPYDVLTKGTESFDFFKPSIMTEEDSSTHFILKSPTEIANMTGKEEPPSRRYFNYHQLHDIIQHYPISEGLKKNEIEKIKTDRVVFSHFLLGLLRYRPHERYTPKQAACHPFLVGGAVDADWQPPRDTRLDERTLFATIGTSPNNFISSRQRAEHKISSRLACSDGYAYPRQRRGVSVLASNGGPSILSTANDAHKSSFSLAPQKKASVIVSASSSLDSRDTTSDDVLSWTPSGQFHQVTNITTPAVPVPPPHTNFNSGIKITSTKRNSSLLARQLAAFEQNDHTSLNNIPSATSSSIQPLTSANMTAYPTSMGAIDEHYAHHHHSSYSGNLPPFCIPQQQNDFMPLRRTNTMSNAQNHQRPSQDRRSSHHGNTDFAYALQRTQHRSHTGNSSTNSKKSTSGKNRSGKNGHKNSGTDTTKNNKSLRRTERVRRSSSDRSLTSNNRPPLQHTHWFQLQPPPLLAPITPGGANLPQPPFVLTSQQQQFDNTPQLLPKTFSGIHISTTVAPPPPPQPPLSQPPQHIFYHHNSAPSSR